MNSVSFFIAGLLLFLALPLASAQELEGFDEPVRHAEKKNHYFLAPGIGVPFMSVNASNSKSSTAYGGSFLLRAGAESRGFLFLVDGSVGTLKGIGTKNQNIFSFGALAGTYLSSMDAYLVFGGEFLGFTEFRSTKGGTLRIGILKDLSDSVQITFEPRVTFLTSTIAATSSTVGSSYTFTGYGAMVGLVFPFRSGIPTDRDLPLIEHSSKNSPSGF